VASSFHCRHGGRRLKEAVIAWICAIRASGCKIAAEKRAEALGMSLSELIALRESRAVGA